MPRTRGEEVEAERILVANADKAEAYAGEAVAQAKALREKAQQDAKKAKADVKKAKADAKYAAEKARNARGAEKARLEREKAAADKAASEAESAAAVAEKAAELAQVQLDRASADARKATAQAGTAEAQRKVAEGQQADQEKFKRLYLDALRTLTDTAERYNLNQDECEAYKKAHSTLTSHLEASKNTELVGETAKAEVEMFARMCASSYELRSNYNRMLGMAMKVLEAVGEGEMWKSELLQQVKALQKGYADHRDPAPRGVRATATVAKWNAWEAEAKKWLSAHEAALEACFLSNIVTSVGDAETSATSAAGRVTSAAALGTLQVGQTVASAGLSAALPPIMQNALTNRQAMDAQRMALTQEQLTSLQDRNNGIERFGIARSVVRELMRPTPTEVGAAATSAVPAVSAFLNVWQTQGVVAATGTVGASVASVASAVWPVVGWVGVGYLASRFAKFLDLGIRCVLWRSLNDFLEKERAQLEDARQAFDIQRAIETWNSEFGGRTMKRVRIGAYLTGRFAAPALSLGVAASSFWSWARPPPPPTRNAINISWESFANVGCSAPPVDTPTGPADPRPVGACQGLGPLAPGDWPYAAGAAGVSSDYWNAWRAQRDGGPVSGFLAAKMRVLEMDVVIRRVLGERYPAPMQVEGGAAPEDRDTNTLIEMMLVCFGSGRVAEALASLAASSARSDAETDLAKHALLLPHAVVKDLVGMIEPYVRVEGVLLQIAAGRGSAYHSEVVRNHFALFYGTLREGADAEEYAETTVEEACAWFDDNPWCAVLYARYVLTAFSGGQYDADALLDLKIPQSAFASGGSAEGETPLDRLRWVCASTILPLGWAEHWQIDRKRSVLSTGWFLRSHVSMCALSGLLTPEDRPERLDAVVQHAAWEAMASHAAVPECLAVAIRDALSARGGLDVDVGALSSSMGAGDASWGELFLLFSEGVTKREDLADPAAVRGFDAANSRLLSAVREAHGGSDGLLLDPETGILARAAARFAENGARCRATLERVGDMPIDVYASVAETRTEDEKLAMASSALVQHASGLSEPSALPWARHYWMLQQMGHEIYKRAPVAAQRKLKYEFAPVETPSTPESRLLNRKRVLPGSVRGLGGDKSKPRTTQNRAFGLSVALARMRIRPVSESTRCR